MWAARGGLQSPVQNEHDGASVIDITLDIWEVSSNTTGNDLLPARSHLAFQKHCGPSVFIRASKFSIQLKPS